VICEGHADVVLSSWEVEKRHLHTCGSVTVLHV